MAWQGQPDLFEEAQVTGNLIASFETAHRTWQAMRDRKCTQGSAAESDVGCLLILQYFQSPLETDTCIKPNLFGPNMTQKRSIERLLARGLLPHELFSQYVMEPPKPRRVIGLASPISSPSSLPTSITLRNRILLMLESPKKRVAGRASMSTHSLPSAVSNSSSEAGVSTSNLVVNQGKALRSVPTSRPHKPRRMTVNEADASIAQIRYRELASSLVWHRDTLESGAVSLTQPSVSSIARRQRTTIFSDLPISFSQREILPLHVPKPIVLSQPFSVSLPAESEQESIVLRWYHIAMLLMVLWSFALIIVLLLFFYVLISAPFSTFTKSDEDH